MSETEETSAIHMLNTPEQWLGDMLLSLNVYGKERTAQYLGNLLKTVARESSTTARRAALKEAADAVREYADGELRPVSFMHQELKTMADRIERLGGGQ